ncbi:carotenoid biosynthesis protein [Maribacter sp. ACAM166]|uniref:carotenoid biosynthesis protein n=1 Tax=Maribacter sp. ACAM166 TaxID=2508996 RepID=UPI0010FDBD60|nr:carotenoid biosynthesis protein [Maribacter sp. ACAM166]TLP76771.1 carotenoid biosynthesis protein [Maribacter sp. ACAM166]
MIEVIRKNKVWLSVGIIWLFHISAIIGISLGNLDWFIEKTPINLGLSFFLFLVVYPINNIKKLSALSLFFIGGMLAEWLGVNYQILFGDYEYGRNFGPKLDGVPYLIGAYWALLTFITASILDLTQLPFRIKVIGAAGLMVVLDFFMEKSAPTFHFWTFTGGMPTFENYWTWFLLGIIFQVVLKLLKIKGNQMFSLNLYLAQLFFFLFFYF